MNLFIENSFGFESSSPVNMFAVNGERCLNGGCRFSSGIRIRQILIAVLSRYFVFEGEYNKFRMLKRKCMNKASVIGITELAKHFH